MTNVLLENDLTNMNLANEVTRMIEMNKLIDTPFEKMNEIEREYVDIDTRDNMQFMYDEGSDPSTGRKIQARIHPLFDIAAIRSDVYDSSHQINFTKTEPVKDLVHHTFNLDMTQLKDGKFLGTKVYPSNIQHVPYNFRTDDDIFTADVIIDNNNYVAPCVYVFVNKALDIPKSFNTSYTKETAVMVMKYDIASANAILRNILRYQLNEKVSTSNVAKALRNFWLHQIQDELKTSHTPTLGLSTELSEIIENIGDALTNNINNKQYTITYAELFEFFVEIKEGNLTEKTSKVQSWISYSSIGDVTDAIATHENFESIRNIRLAPTSVAKKIKGKLLEDRTLKRKYHVGKILAVHDAPTPKKHEKVFRGVHGSTNGSFISILLNGLRTETELRNQKIDHKYTASGLGSGVYFAQLNQASKSSNYTGMPTNERNYMYIADVVYDPKSVYKTRNYNNGRGYNGETLIYAEGVGSKGLDEIVAPNSKNVTIRYVVELISKH